MRVSCIIKISNKKPRKILSQCRTIDLFTTIAEISGGSLESCLQNIQGESLFDLTDKSVVTEREVFVETVGLYGPWPSPKKHNVFCIRVNNQKLIYNDNHKSWEFYDLKNDPYEKNNIYDEKSDTVISLKEKLLLYLKENNIKTNIT